MDTSTCLTRLTVAIACLAAVPLAHADTVNYLPIPGAGSANDMSPDGRFICGESTFATGFAPYIYDTFERTLTLLPSTGLTAVAISDDGRTVVGAMEDPGTGAEIAAIWHASTNTWESMGSIPGGGECPSLSSAYELSADGTVAVGLCWVNGCKARAFRWTDDTGMVPMDELGNGGNRASVVSANGSLIAGFAQGAGDRTPAVWGASGAGQLLDPPNGNAQGEIFGMNPSGSILLGIWNGKATKWTNGTSVRTTVGAGSTLPGWSGNAMAIANTGTIVGFDIIGGYRRAWIQPNGTGPLVDLATYVTSNGGAIPDDVNLDVCQAISADGTRIIGHGFSTGAFMVTVQNSTGCTADITPPGGNLVVDGADLGYLLGSWGSPAADLNGDGNTDGADLGILLGAWGACPVPTGACCVDGICSQKTASECEASNGTFLGNYTACSPISCVNNDACSQAVDITANMLNNTPVHGDNSVATPPKFGGGDPELPVGSPTCHWDGNPGAVHSTVWYSFVAPESGAVHISTCNSVAVPFYDSTLGVYSGTCGSLVEIACNDDGCGDPIGSAPYYSDIVVTGMTPGVVYYVCVMNPGDWEGSMAGPFILNIESF